MAVPSSQQQWFDFSTAPDSGIAVAEPSTRPMHSSAAPPPVSDFAPPPSPVVAGGKPLVAPPVAAPAVAPVVPTPAAALNRSLAVSPPLLDDTPVQLRRSEKAKRFRLTVGRDGEAVLTMPSRGSERQAREFLASQRDWLERTRTRLAQLPRSAVVWTIGTSVMFRGEWREIRRVEGAPPRVTLGDGIFRVHAHEGDLRPTLEAHLLRLARIELPARTWELAAITGVEVREVTVRNQRTRWGSCSSNGTVSLNWRLVQAPPFVADYIVFHELMHLREMNHSPRFWAQVAAVCPRWEEAERWLKHHGGALGL